MKLYYHPISSNSRKVRITGGLLGVQIEQHIVDMLAGGQGDPAYTALNPNALLPTLEDDDFVLWESNAICQYIASKVPNDLWPDNTRVRADIARWQFWEPSHWVPAIRVFVIENMFKERMGWGAPDPVELKKAEDTFRRFATVLNSHLGARDYLVGDGLTLADISVSVHLMYAEPAKLPLADFPNVEQWFAGIEALPQWRDTAPAELG